MLMIITRIEWVYHVEPVEHLHLKDADVVTNGVEQLDASHLDVDLPALDVSHLDVSHLDVDHQAP